MEIECVQTNRLMLRKITPEVLHYVFEHYADEALMSFLDIANEEALAKEKAKMAKGIATYNKSFVHFQMILKENDLNIGGCGFHTWYLEHRRAEIGYSILNDNYKQLGLMKESMAMVLEYGFETMNLNRIEAMVAPSNVVSLKLLSHFKFEQEGHLRQHYCKHGSIEDSLMFGLLKDEWHLNKSL